MISRKGVEGVDKATGGKGVPVLNLINSGSVEKIREFFLSFTGPQLALAPAGAQSGVFTPRFNFGGMTLSRFHDGGAVVGDRAAAALSGNRPGGSGGFNFVMNVNNQTGTPVAAQNTRTQLDTDKLVVDIVLRNINGYGSIHHAIRSVRP